MHYNNLIDEFIKNITNKPAISENSNLNPTKRREVRVSTKSLCGDVGVKYHSV